MNSNNQKINIWELGSRINIKINKSFIDFINNKIKEKYKTKSKAHKEMIKYYPVPFLTFKDKLKRGYKYFIDLEILLGLCKIFGISQKTLQKNIVAYKTRRSHNYVTNPKLPIKITPIFDMLIAHNIGDGGVVKPKGRIPYFGYTQCNKEIRLLYLKKLESLFGKIYYNNEHHSTSRNIYCPSVFTNLFQKIYSLKLEDFYENQARVPREIFNKNDKHKLAFLLGIILDEGHVDSTLIVISLKNHSFLKDLQKICQSLGYSTSFTKVKENRYCLYINSRSLIKFYNDYNNLLKEYPEVNLCYKGLKIIEFVKRRKKQKLYRPGNKPHVLKALSKRFLTVNEIAVILNMTRQGARYLINDLVKDKKIQVKSIVKYGAFQYGLR